jgi:hypothetical protein
VTGGIDIAALERDMTQAAAAAERLCGRPALGLRVVDSGTGGRMWLVAYEGPRFAVLDARLAPVELLARVRDVAQAGVASELVEDAVDAALLRAVRPEAEVLGRVAISAEDPLGVQDAAMDALMRAVHAAERLADWRDAPARIVASLVALDEAAVLQGRAHAAYATFAALTEPLVQRQADLRPDVLAALVGVEQAAAAAGLGAPLAAMIGESMGGIAEAADEMARAHITPLR